MKKTPEIIWLRPDPEDPDYIVWGNDQPADGGESVKYFRFDAINKHHPRQIFKNESTLKKGNKL